MFAEMRKLNKVGRKPGTADGILEDEFSRQLDPKTELLCTQAADEARDDCQPLLKRLCTSLRTWIGLKNVDPLALWKMLEPIPEPV